MYPVEYLLKGSVDFDEPLNFHSLVKAKPKPDLINQRDFDASSSGDTQSSDGNSSSVGPSNEVRSPVVSFAVLLFSSIQPCSFMLLFVLLQLLPHVDAHRHENS